jgi:hypothetical protein
MRNKLRSTITCTILLVLCCLAATLLIPFTNSPPEININRVQFEEAMRKWESLQVVEYAMVVEAKPGYPFVDLEGTWTVKVSHDRAMATSGPYQGDVSDIWFLRISGQFSDIDAILTQHDKGVLDERFFRSVSFDSVLGYPKSIEESPRMSPDLGLLIFGERNRIRVTNLEILSTKVFSP